MARAIVEMRILKAGVSWEALEKASEERVVEWVAALNEIEIVQQEENSRHAL